MNSLNKKESFLKSIEKIQEIILKIQNGNLKEKYQKITKEKLKSTNFLFFKLTESSNSISIYSFFLILFFIFFIFSLILIFNFVCLHSNKKENLKQICLNFPNLIEIFKKKFLMK